jgi:hypothetical protein
MFTVKAKKESTRIVKELSEIRRIDESIIKDIMKYNVLTPVQFRVLTGFTRAKVEMMLYPRPMPKLTVVHPFSAYMGGEGPKFILKDQKFYELLNYLTWRGKKKTKSLTLSSE